VIEIYNQEANSLILPEIGSDISSSINRSERCQVLLNVTSNESIGFEYNLISLGSVIIILKYRNHINLTKHHSIATEMKV